MVVQQTEAGKLSRLLQQPLKRGPCSVFVGLCCSLSLSQGDRRCQRNVNKVIVMTCNSNHSIMLSAPHVELGTCKATWQHAQTHPEMLF